MTHGYANQDFSPGPADNFDAAEWIDAERLRLVYANLPITLIVSVLTACVLGLVLYDVVSHFGLLTWLCAA